MTKTELRNLLRAVYGKGKFRLTRRGEIHVYGRLPNSTSTGWYLRCFDDREGRQTMIQAALDEGIAF